MDNKDKYSASVTAQNILSNQDEHLRERIEKAHKRKTEHWDNWQAVDINEVIQRFAPDATPETKGVKVNWHSPTTGLTVVADVSGYLRIQDMNPGTIQEDLPGHQRQPHHKSSCASWRDSRAIQGSPNENFAFPNSKAGENEKMKEETFFVQVPDNEEGIWGFLKGDMAQVKTFVFTESETNFLMDLYDRFNERFDKMIDFYETEHLVPECLADALKMTQEFAEANQTSQFLPSIQKLQQAVELAIRNNVWLIFDF